MAQQTQQSEYSTVRIPLVGTFNTREFDSTASVVTGPTSGTVGVGVVGQMIVGNQTLLSRDQRFVNCIPTQIENKLNEQKTFYLVKRPGFELDASPAGAVTGKFLAYWGGRDAGAARVTAWGTPSEIFVNTTSIGSITGSCVFILEVKSGTTPAIVIQSDDNTLWVFVEGGALTKVSDVDYPGNAGKTVKPGCVFLDGYLFVMDSNGVVYNSDLNSLTAWSANASINTDGYPDKGITLARYRNTIAAFSTTSIEFFSDIGNPTGTPLINNLQSAIKIGASHHYAVGAVEDVLVWVSSTQSGGSSVYTLEGYVPKKISTPIIEQQITMGAADTAKLNAVKFFGRTFVFLILANNTYVYCVEDDIWHEWDSDHNYWDFLVAASVGVNHIYGISTEASAAVQGKVFKINVDDVIYQDNGTPYTMSVITSKVDLGNNYRKRISRLSIIGDKQQQSSTLGISWSDDDYVTFSSTRNVNLNDARPYINNCGLFRRRAFKLTNSVNTGVRLEAIELDLIQGTN